MKKLTVNEFEELLKGASWRHEQELEIVERLGREIFECDEDGDPVRTEIPHVWGWASVTSECAEIKIVYTEGFDYDECEPDSLSTGTEGQENVWEMEGAIVVDEDGDPVNIHYLADLLDEEFSAVDYSSLEIEKITDIDIDDGAGMETFTLEINNEPNIRFTGELIATSSSTDNRACGSSYSGQTGRWTELSLYKTSGGKFICHQIGRTRWQGEKDRFSGAVCETIEEVKNFFGHRWLAKELYENANIEDVKDVE